VVDNGQHAMMGCYTETLAFLTRIAAAGKLVRQRNLRVDMVDVRRGRGTIACARLPGPLHMLGAVLGYRLLSRAERLAALRGGLRLLAMRRRRDPWLAGATVTALLARLGQSANACASFWHPVAIATLNERPERAAAAPFAEVLARAFLGARRDSEFVLPGVGLGDLYTGDARRYLEQRGGRIECRAQVAAIDLAGDRVAGVALRDGRHVPAAACVAAVPPRALVPLLPPPARCALRPERLEALESSPIVSAHLWYDRPVLRQPFVGLIGTTTQWLFNRSRLLGIENDGGQCVSAVISGDREVAGWETGRIAAAVDADVRAVLPAARLAQAVVVKEKHATIAPTPAAERLRPPTETPIAGFVLAGDWIATGLPPTIESAVVSGHRAAAALQSQWR
jgi:squalene-associated FAD-dependent desaturase